MFHNYLNVADVDIIPVGEIGSLISGVWENLKSMDRAAQSHFLKEAADEFVRHGEKLFSYNDFEGAESSFSRALELQSDSAEALNNLGVIYNTLAYKENALQYLEAAVKIQPDNATHLRNLAELYYAVFDRTEEAITIYLRILNNNPNDVDTLLALGQISIAKGLWEQAKIYYQRALQIEPSNNDVKQILITLEDLKVNPDRCINATEFSRFTYSKKSHFLCFDDYDLRLYGKKINPLDSDLKVYQDLLIYTFIQQNISKGAKILEIGGGISRILPAIKDYYECWNIDKMEGLGNGPTTETTQDYRLIKDYIGNFPERPPGQLL